MFDTRTLLILIPALPLAAALLIGALGKKVLRGRSHLPLVVAIALSCLLSLVLVVQVQQGFGVASSVSSGWHVPDGHRRAALVDEGRGNHLATPFQGVPPQAENTSHAQIFTYWRWADVAGASTTHRFQIDITLRADSLTAVMLATVTFISLLVAVYSTGYMHGDAGYWRFFAYFGLFVFSMTMLVSVSNFLLLYVFWEGVGLCSYLLIGFWFEKPAAAAAGKKAFLVNRVGDSGFAIAVFLIWLTYGWLDFDAVLSYPGRLAGGLGTAVCLLLLLGACGKSAQFPLHVWLPDAMEGPTPVSALIHAATMVTAGVYLVARCTPLFVGADGASLAVALVGGVTALLAALIALSQTDLKRILAYSTISQLGYMFLGLGAASLAGVTAGMFHLVTHAFFKALLFLGAGSVMHAMGGVIDIRRVGGLRRRLPVTHWTFLAGCLALAGVFPFAGFWSKDAIIEAVGEAGLQHAGTPATLYDVLYWIALVTTFLTACYTFRAYFVTFWGPERVPEEAGHHAHESPPVMTWPLAILALGALLVGAALERTGALKDFLSQTPTLNHLARLPAISAGSENGGLVVMISGSLAALAGIALAAALYLRPGPVPARLARTLDRLGLYQLSYHKFYLDEIYEGLIVGPLRALAWLAAAFDRWVIDGLVDFCAQVPVALGAALRPLQGGVLQFYALVMLLGLLALLGALLM